MSTYQSDSHKHSHLMDEHEQLRDLLCQCQNLIRRQNANTEIITSTLDEMSSHIKRHFHHEEENGYFTEEVALKPHLKNQVETLLHQHPKFLKDLARIRKYAIACDVSPHWWQSLDEQFTDFLDEYFDHEHQENKLLQDTYTEDLGAKD